MKLNIEKVSYDGRDFEFGNAKLTIRPYPQSRLDITVKDGALILVGSNARDMFIYCLTKWEGVLGADDQPIKMTDDIKKKIYDFKLCVIEDENGDQINMSDFVIRTARKLTDDISQDTKN